MAIQVQPFNFGAQLKQQRLADIASNQRQQQLDQSQQRLGMQQQQIDAQIDQFAQRMGMDRDTLTANTALKILQIEDPNQYRAAVQSLAPVFGEDIAALDNPQIIEDKATRQKLIQEIAAEERRLKLRTIEARESEIAANLSRQDIDARKIEADAVKAEEAAKQAKLKTQAEQESVRAGQATKAEIAAEATRLIGLGEKEIDNIYGSFLGFAEPLMTQEEIDLEGDINRLVSLLTLGNLEKMSGVLSDSDIKILETAGSKLADRRMSAPKAMAELRRIKEVFSRAPQQKGRFIVRKKN